MCKVRYFFPIYNDWFFCRQIIPTVFGFILMWMRSRIRKNYCRLWKEPHLGIVMLHAILFELNIISSYYYWKKQKLSHFISAKWPDHFLYSPFFIFSVSHCFPFFFCLHLFPQINTNNWLRIHLLRHLLSESLFRRNLSISHLAIYELPGTSDLSKFCFIVVVFFCILFFWPQFYTLL